MKLRSTSKLVIRVLLVINLLFIFNVFCFQQDTFAQEPLQTSEFLYTASGQRIAKLSGEGDHTYYLPGVEVTVKPDGNISYRRYYNFNGRLTAVKEDTRLTYTHSDQLGSAALTTDANGSLVGSAAYFPYGTTRGLSGTMAGERKYTGQVSDEDMTGLYYYNARYYSPTMGRFTQADTVDSGLNRYAYVSNNPINLTDPTGHIAEDPVMHDWDEGETGGPNDDWDIVDQGFLSDLSDPHYCPGCSQIPDPQDMTESEAMGYGHIVFRRMLEHVIYNTPNWEDMNDLERINVLTMYLNQNIPYSSRLSAIMARMAYLNAFINSSREEPDIQPLLLSHYSAARQTYNSMWSEKSWSTPYYQYEHGLFVCYNFTDLLSMWVQTALPGITVYAGGIPGHAFVVFKYESEFYVADPAIGILLPLIGNGGYSELLQIYPFQIGFNFEASSVNASYSDINAYLHNKYIPTVK